MNLEDRLADVVARVADLERGAGDTETDHIHEDQIHRDALRTIAEDSTDTTAAALARAALRTEEFIEDHWYA